nr:MAG TPA: hypothetical protein [Caudoviricetes sp.]
MIETGRRREETINQRKARTYPQYTQGYVNKLFL